MGDPEIWADGVAAGGGYTVGDPESRADGVADG